MPRIVWPDRFNPQPLGFREVVQGLWILALLVILGGLLALGMVAELWALGRDQPFLLLAGLPLLFIVGRASGIPRELYERFLDRKGRPGGLPRLQSLPRPGQGLGHLVGQEAKPPGPGGPSQAGFQSPARQEVPGQAVEVDP